MSDCSDDEVELVNAKKVILDQFANLNDNQLNVVEQWISSKSYKDDLKNKNALIKAEKKLSKIAEFIKPRVPFEAELKSESIEPPTVGDQADCTKVNTCHIDEFLYEEEEVDELVKEGKLKRHYCLDCNSRNTEDLIFISHSMSKKHIQCIYKFYLPSDLEGKQILDVGSRLGVVLYGAYYFSNASTIVGIEMNKELCELQESVISKYSMDKNRIKVICSDVMDTPDIVAESNVITINVLDFFVSTEKQKEMWHFFKKHIKKGTYLICNRAMDETLEGLDISEEFWDWLDICKPQQLENEIFFSDEDIQSMYMYLVK
ncbi:hypothetical protein NE865_01829 [Phthorimaea operculella]|nr:hypothetical protein NE865_01829 [Phthorimaea operculella]